MTVDRDRARPFTLHLDGLLEGGFPPIPGTEAKLREWPAAARRAGFRFSLELERGRFSILADTDPVRLDPEVQVDPTARIAATLDSFLDAIPAGHRGVVTSSVRSVEYRPLSIVETAFGVGPDGRVEPVSRERPWTPPAQPSRATKLKPLLLRGGFVLIIVAMFLGATGFFADPKRSLANLGLVDLPAPPLPTVDASAFRGLLAAEILGVGPDGITLGVRTTDACPPSLAEYEAMRGWAVRLRHEDGWRALEAAFSGRIEVEYRDADGVRLAVFGVQVPGLRSEREPRVLAPFDERQPPALIVLRP